MLHVQRRLLHFHWCREILWGKRGWYWHSIYVFFSSILAVVFLFFFLSFFKYLFLFTPLYFSLSCFHLWETKWNEFWGEMNTPGGKKIKLGGDSTEGDMGATSLPLLVPRFRLPRTVFCSFIRKVLYARSACYYTFICRVMVEISSPCSQTKTNDS